MWVLHAESDEGDDRIVAACEPEDAALIVDAVNALAPLLDLADERDRLAARVEHRGWEHRWESFEGPNVVEPGKAADQADALVLERDRLREVLRGVEWSADVRVDEAGKRLYGHCPRCRRPEHHGHELDCPIGDALNRPHLVVWYDVNLWGATDEQADAIRVVQSGKASPVVEVMVQDGRMRQARVSSVAAERGGLVVGYRFDALRAPKEPR